jgi:hypothetical protein
LVIYVQVGEQFARNSEEQDEKQRFPEMQKDGMVEYGQPNGKQQEGFRYVYKYESQQ